MSFTFRSKIHFALTFVDGARYVLKFTFLLLYIQKSKRTLLSTLNYFGLLLKISCLYMYGSIYRLYSVLLICLSLCQCRRLMCWNQVVLFFKVDLAIQNLWHFHLNFIISFFQLLKWKKFLILLGIMLNLQTNLERTWVSLRTHEHWCLSI